MSQESWVEKYRPEAWSDVQGNNSSIKKIKNWARNWRPGDKPIILVGPAGTGKTTSAYVLSKEMGWDLQQINTSSARTSDDIKSLARNMQGSTIDGSYQLILLDEVDSWHHSSNKRPLTKVLSDPRNPIIMTANDGYSIPNSIKNRAKNFGKYNWLKFKLSKSSRRAKLNDIAKSEELDLSDAHLDKLAERDDLRSSINDLQLYKDSDNAPGNDKREMEMSEWQAIDNIIRGKKDIGHNITPSDFIHWLDENIPERYSGLETAMAYKAMAESDKFLGIAQSTQDYHYWKYAGELQEQVANVRLTEPFDGYINKNFPQWFRQSSNHVKDGSSTASLFNKLKDTKEGRFKFGGNYQYFRNVLLPIIRDLDDETKYQMILENRLDTGEMQELGITEAQYDDWRETTGEEESNITQSDALDW